MIGKAIRLERIFNRSTGKCLIVPMDHGMSNGPIFGITNMKTAMAQVANGGANAVVVHKGIVGSGHRQSGPDMGLIIHLSASTSLAVEPNTKTLICTVEEAIKLGADAVSVHINIGDANEKQMLEDVGNVAYKAMEWGMPMLAMIYPRGPNVDNEFDPKFVAHAARLGAELGADVVKVSYTGDKDSFRKVVDGCHKPVVIAGGPKMTSDKAILQMVRDAIDAGASGTSIGRNIFQHKNPEQIVQAISKIVHENASIEEALEIIQ